MSPVKGGEQAIYLEYIICGQIMPIANPDPSINLDTHKFEENQVLIYVPVCNISTGLCGGLKKMLGHITLWGDEGERYYSYVSQKKKAVSCIVLLKILCLTFSTVRHSKNMMGFFSMKIRKKCLFLNSFFISPLLRIEKRNFCNGKITFIYIQLM